MKAPELVGRLQLGWRPRRLPVVLQTEAAECGLACLAMVAGHHGHAVDLATLRQRHAMSAKGATAVELVRIAGRLQLGARALRAEIEHLGRLSLPCVLHWDMNHFVVLAEVGRDHVVIHDPARGARRLPMAEVSRHFTGVVLELTPQPGFERRDERRPVQLRSLLGRVTGLKRSLGQILLLALVLELFTLLSPFLLQWVVDGVLVSADRDLLVTLGIGFALLVLAQVAVGALRSWAVLHLSASLNLQWVANLFAHLLRLPVAWFEKRHTGDVQSRFGALQQIQQVLTTSFLESVIDGLLVVTTLVMMAVYSPRLSAIAVGAVVLYAAARALAFRAQREANEEAIVHDARRASHFLESLRGVQSIKLFNRQEDRHSRHLNHVVDTMNALIGARRIELTLAVAQKLFFGLERVAVVWVGALLVLDRQFSVGMLFAFLAYKEQFATRVAALIDKAVELRMLGLQAERLADIALAEPERDDDGAAPRSDLPARLELRGVAFAYADGEPPVLADLSLAIEPGESVAIVGPSGCGKTTLLKLMLGIHAPQQGEIRVAGIPLNQLGLRNWRDMVGTVMQDDHLFAGSIADNIAFFDLAPDAAWIEQCARMAAVHDEISALPMGYHTLIGDMGSSLSGGQRQRILLARALYKRPKILFLDEATSALDLEREREVNHSIRALNLTRVIVAHRPETIASATRVVVLQQGRVAQDLRSVPASATG